MKKPLYAFLISLLFGVTTILLALMSLDFLAYLSGGLAIAAFIWWAVLLALSFRASPISPTVLEALISALQNDEDPGVRSRAAVGLAELDLEESFDWQEHDGLDEALISALQHDKDPRVRSKAAVGLAELELEQEQRSYHHKHDKLDDMLFE